MYRLCCVFEYHVLYKSAICASLHLKHSQTVIGCTRLQKHLPLLLYETVTPHYTLKLLWRLAAASHKCNLDTQCNRRKGERIIATPGVKDEMFFVFFPMMFKKEVTVGAMSSSVFGSFFTCDMTSNQRHIVAAVYFCLRHTINAPLLVLFLLCLYCTYQM